MDAIFSRNSVRKFTEEMPSEEQIERLLRAAMAAPSAKNQQPWEFFVVTNKDCLQKLSEATPYSMCVKNAQAAFVLASRRDGIIAPEFRDIDMAIASENILLELEALGLGGVMIWHYACDVPADNDASLFNAVAKAKQDMSSRTVC